MKTFYSSLPDREDLGVEDYGGLRAVRGALIAVVLSLPFWAALFFFVIHHFAKAGR